MKQLKTNPSAEYIGFKMTAPAPIPVNLRQGKQNVIHVTGVEVTKANATGRRLTCVFQLNGQEILTRRVYLEHLERMMDKFGVDLP
jgi:hypothetical protein